LLGGGLGAALGLVGCSDQARIRAAGDFEIACGSPRGVSYAWAQILSQELGGQQPDLNLVVRESSGSVENLYRLRDGDSQLALAAMDAAVPAFNGGPPFVSKMPIAALARVYDEYLHVLVRADSRIETLAQLANRAVAIGPVGSGTSLVANRVFQEARIQIRPVALDLIEAGQALQGQRIDALAWIGGLPTRGVSELAARVRLRLLSLESVAVALRARYGSAYRQATIAAGSYGQDSAVPTVATPMLLLGTTSTDAALVYDLLSGMFGVRNQIVAAVPAAAGMDAKLAIATAPIPLHDTAAEYYRSIKP
jgi:TRAP transporter TAXI family solute receptor